TMAAVTGGSIDPSTASGAMLATILGSVATHFSTHKSEQQCAAAAQKAAAGRPQWRRAFGYLPYTGSKEDDQGVRHPDPVTAPLVAQAYELLLGRESLGKIMALFNEHEWLDKDNTVRRGCYGLNGRPWTRSTVSLFLRDARNGGLRSHNNVLVRDKSGRPVKGTWDALVPAKTWLAAQAVLTDPRRAPGQKSVQKHLLTGLLRCGKPGCGHHLSGHITKTGVAAYNCKKCRGVSIRAEHAEPHIFGLVAERLSRPDARDLLKADIDEGEAETIRQELGELYARLESIGVAVGEGDLTIAQAKAATDTVNAKIAPLERRQLDSEKLRVFAGLPLGDPAVVDAIDALPEGRFRGIVDLLCTVTVMPVGKGNKQFRPDRVVVDWR
ncbi:MAG TPA: recombinase family protein, partial [Mycobacterium sp.]|nr:recombinase family protein [Mycobacterium sp.]